MTCTTGAMQHERVVATKLGAHPDVARAIIPTGVAGATGCAKTDILLIMTNGSQIGLSLKMDNAGFVENHARLERIRQILGEDEQRYGELVEYAARTARTMSAALKQKPLEQLVGYQLGVAPVSCRRRGFTGFEMSVAEQLECYTGAGGDKLDILAGNECFPGAGVATHYLKVSREQAEDATPEELMLMMEVLDEDFVRRHPVAFTVMGTSIRMRKQGDRLVEKCESRELFVALGESGELEPQYVPVPATAYRTGELRELVSGWRTSAAAVLTGMNTEP